MIGCNFFYFSYRCHFKIVNLLNDGCFQCDIPSVLSIFYKPKSILGLFVAGGILFLLISGATITINAEMHDFFFKWVLIMFLIGIAGWMLFIIPTIVGLFSK